MKTFKIPTTVEITEQRISDMLTSAFEGGTNHWMTIKSTDLTRLSESFNGILNVEKLILAGASIPIYDVEDKNSHLGDLNMLNIIAALIAMAQSENIEEGHFRRLKEHFDNFINENDDAETADVIVQIAVMERVVYG